MLWFQQQIPNTRNSYQTLAETRSDQQLPLALSTPTLPQKGYTLNEGSLGVNPVSPVGFRRFHSFLLTLLLAFHLCFLLAHACCSYFYPAFTPTLYFLLLSNLVLLSLFPLLSYSLSDLFESRI